MTADIQLVFPHTVEKGGLAHQFQGAGTNDCGPTSLAMAVNLLAWQKGFVTEPHAIPKTLVAEAMQNESRWWGMGGYRVTQNLLGLPTKGATFARVGMLRAFAAINRSWEKLGYASLGRASFRVNGTKENLLENIAQNCITAVRWVWDKPYKNGSHWVTVVGYNRASDEFLVLNPALPHHATAPEENIQRVRWP